MLLVQLYIIIIIITIIVIIVMRIAQSKNGLLRNFTVLVILYN